MIDVSLISAAETIPLRHEVLRVGRPVETCIFPGDELSSTRHYGAFQEGQLVGVASFYDQPPPWDTTRQALQLRGMAVRDTLQGLGVGSQLLEAALAEMALQPELPRLVWCNARTRAVPFYLRHGFSVLGDEFEIAGVGPHFRMVRPF